MTRRVLVGRIVSARGVKGEVRVYPLVDDPDFFSRVEQVWLGSPDEEGEPRRILGFRRWRHYALLQLEGVVTRSDAEALAGAKLSVPASEMPLLDEGLYYHFQLEGMKVETEDGRLLGVLDQIMETGSNDVYVVLSPEGEELLIPATNEVVRSVNLDERIIVVAVMEGMFGED